MIHCLITIGSNRILEGRNMLKSVAPQYVKVHLLLRGNELKDSPILENVETQLWTESASLSEARNILIAELQKNDLVRLDDIVCFSDDDGCWQENFHERIYSAFSNDEKLVIGGYFPSEFERDTNRFPRVNHPSLSLDQILKMTSSLGIYMRGELFLKVGFFNENLGLGGEIPVGEDTEFCVRAFKISKQASYDQNLMQIHNYGSHESRKEASISLIWFLVSRDLRILPLAFRRIIGVMRESPQISWATMIKSAWKGTSAAVRKK